MAAPEVSTTIDRLLSLAQTYADQPTDDNFAELRDGIETVCPTEKSGIENYSALLTVCRVFHEFLTLAEVAERQHRIRRWRAYRRGESELFFKQTCKDAFNTLVQKGFTPEKIRETLLKQHVELVLTAHPTQAARRTLLDKYFKYVI